MKKKEINELIVKSENQNKKSRGKLFCFWCMVIFLFVITFGNIIIRFISNIIPNIAITPNGFTLNDFLLEHFNPGELKLISTIQTINLNVFIMIVIFQLIMYFFVFPVLNYSLCKIHLKISRGENIKFSDFFNPQINFKIYIKIVVLCFFKVFSTLVCLIPLAIPCLIYDYLHFINKNFFVMPGPDLVLFLLSYLMIVPAIVHFNSCFSFYYILIDNPEMGLLEIFKKAEIIIKGHRKEYLKAWFRFFSFAIIIICVMQLHISWLIVLFIMSIIVFMMSVPPILLVFILMIILIVALNIQMLEFKTFQANYYQYIKEKDDLK